MHSGRTSLPAPPRHPVPGPHNWRDHASVHGPKPQPPSALPPCLLDDADLIYTASGRAAILLGLEALALGPQARVLIPSYHCPTMASPVLTLGHQLGFYPIGADGVPDLAWLEREAPADVKVLCVVHFFGLPRDLREVKAWCQRRGVLMLEDCAHALFGRSPGGTVGALGDVAIGSLPKFLATQDGGVLRIRSRSAQTITLQPAGLKAELKAWLDDLELARTQQRLGRWSLWAQPLLALKQALRRPAPPAPQPSSAGETPRFDPDGEYARIDTALSHRAPSRVALRAARRTARGRVVTQRRAHYQRLVEAFSGLPTLRPLAPHLPEHCAPYVFPLWSDRPDPGYLSLRQMQVPISRWDWLWPGVPDMPGDHGKAWSRHVLQLHCHQDLTEHDLDWTIRAVKTHCSQPTD